MRSKIDLSKPRLATLALPVKQIWYFPLQLLVWEVKVIAGLQSIYSFEIEWILI